MFSRWRRKQLEAWSLYFFSGHNDVVDRNICEGANQINALGPPPDVVNQ